MFLENLNQIPKDSKIALYGCGSLSAFFEEVLYRGRKDVKVSCYINSFRSGTHNGLPVIHIDDISKESRRYDKIIIVSHYWNEIVEALKERGIDDALIFNDVIPRFIYTMHEEESYHRSFKRVRDLLQEETDKALFDALIKARRQKTGSFTHIDECIRGLDCGKEKYLDYINIEAIRTVIEGGVYIGEYTLEFLNGFPNLGLLYGFDPFTDIFMSSPKRPKLLADKRFMMFPLALFNKKARIPLHISDGMASLDIHNTCSGNMQLVTTTTIDDFVVRHHIEKIDYIKMDIEASELEALKGGEKTLRKSRPQMAVCIYHIKEHLFEIPLYLSSILNDYVFKLGHYSNHFGETVLYAIPKEKYMI